MSRDRERRRERSKQDEEQIVYNGMVREDCPCPKLSCKRHKLCGLCQEYHKKMPPYCEREKK